METGWRHRDPEAQREFERLQQKRTVATGATETAQDGSERQAPTRSSPSQEIVVRSPIGTIDVTRSSRPGRIVYDIERPLVVSQDMVPVQSDLVTQRIDTVRQIDFRAGANIDLSVFRHSDGVIAVEIASTGGGGGGMTSWWLDDAYSAPTEITDGETVVFTGTNGATVTRVGNTINIDAPAAYTWRAQASFAGSPMTVSNNEIVYFVANNPTVVVTQLDGGTSSQVLFESPLTFHQTHDTDVIDNSTSNQIVNVYFENEVAAKPGTYTKRVWFDVTETFPSSGIAKVEGWYEDDAGAGSYDWTISDGTTTEVITSGQTVIFAGGTNITTTYDIATNTLTIDNTYGYSWFLQANADPTTEISDGETVTFTGSGTATVSRTGNTIDINVPAYTYSWFLRADGDVADEISNTETVEFISGTNISLVRVGNVITVNAAAYPDYNWIVSDGTTTENVTDGETVVIQGFEAVTVVNVAGTLTVSRPFTIEDDNVAVGGTDTAVLNFDSNGQTTTAVAVNFVVTDDGSGQRSVKAYVPASAGSYDWTVSDGTLSETVTTGMTVIWTGTSGVVTSYDAATNTMTIDRPLTIMDDAVAVGPDDTIEIDFDSQGVTSTGQAVNFVVFNDGAGRRRIQGFVPAAAGTYDWNISDGTDTETVTSGSTITFTGSGPITVDYDTATNTVTVSAPAYPDYNWLLAAEGTPGTEDITDGETVTFRAVGLGVDRVTNTITYRQLPDDTVDPATGGRIKVGYVEWDLTGVVAPTDGRYGYKKSVDIVHNWGLINMHMFTIYVSDVIYDVDPASLGYGTDKIQYRDGATTLAGETPGDQYVRLFPYIQAVDTNTVRLWITHSRNFPTTMKMWYVLKEV